MASSENSKDSQATKLNRTGELPLCDKLPVRTGLFWCKKKCLQMEGSVSGQLCFDNGDGMFQWWNRTIILVGEVSGFIECTFQIITDFYSSRESYVVKSSCFTLSVVPGTNIRWFASTCNSNVCGYDVLYRHHLHNVVPKQTYSHLHG